LHLRPQKIWDRTVVLLATGLGVGYAPVMPGTFGSLLGIGLAWLLAAPALPLFLRITVEAAILLMGIPICARGARHFGKPDPGAVVFDEIAAVPLVFLSAAFTPITAVLAFILFRVFDILKPWPVRQLERLPGGLGIMADDVAAALYAAAALWLCMQALGLLSSP
jgi:phosphatidylglycerophosphatase A